MTTLLLANATFTLVARIVLMALMLIAAVYVIIIVMMQESNDEGLGAIGGQSSENESFYGENKAKSKERTQKVLTIVASVVIAVCSILFYIIAK